MDHRRYNPINKKQIKLFKNQVLTQDARIRVNNLTVNPIRELKPYEKEIICKRRSIRKEVLIASGKAGSGNRRSKYKDTSKIKC
jgi:hypothetical protein